MRATKFTHLKSREIRYYALLSNARTRATSVLTNSPDLANIVAWIVMQSLLTSSALYISPLLIAPAQTY
jgi:hypothetical protein